MVGSLSPQEFEAQKIGSNKVESEQNRDMWWMLQNCELSNLLISFNSMRQNLLEG